MSASLAAATVLAQIDPAAGAPAGTAGAADSSGAVAPKGKGSGKKGAAASDDGDPAAAASQSTVPLAPTAPVAVIVPNPAAMSLDALNQGAAPSAGDDEAAIGGIDASTGKPAAARPLLAAAGAGTQTNPAVDPASPDGDADPAQQPQETRGGGVRAASQTPKGDGSAARTAAAAGVADAFDAGDGPTPPRRDDAGDPVPRGDGSTPSATSAANPGPTATPVAQTSAASVTRADAPATAPAPVAVGDVGVTIAAQAQSGKSHFEIRLDPPDLGRINVQLSVDSSGNLNSRVVVDRPETLDLLRRDAPQLERALQDAGFNTAGGMQFSLGGQGFANQNAFAQNGTFGYSSRVAAIGDDVAPVAAAQIYGSSSARGGGIDISV